MAAFMVLCRTISVVVPHAARRVQPVARRGRRPWLPRMRLLALNPTPLPGRHRVRVRPQPQLLLVSLCFSCSQLLVLRGVPPVPPRPSLLQSSPGEASRCVARTALGKLQFPASVLVTSAPSGMGFVQAAGATSGTKTWLTKDAVVIRSTARPRRLSDAIGNLGGLFYGR